jgi:hypothetical protein
MNQQKVTRDNVADTSGDALEAQVAKLRSLFPEVFVEGKIDFDKLKATFGGAAESGRKGERGHPQFSLGERGHPTSITSAPSCGVDVLLQ